jgi:hypothetical protein
MAMSFDELKERVTRLNATESTPRTGRTRPVGILPPANVHPQNAAFTILTTIEEPAITPQDIGWFSQGQASRSTTVAATTRQHILHYWLRNRIMKKNKTIQQVRTGCWSGDSSVPTRRQRERVSGREFEISGSAKSHGKMSL